MRCPPPPWPLPVTAHNKPWPKCSNSDIITFDQNNWHYVHVYSISAGEFDIFSTIHRSVRVIMSIECEICMKMLRNWS